MDVRRAITKRRVVVTGVGAVSAAGWGVPALRTAVRSGRTSIGPFDRFDHAAQRTHIAGQVPAAAARRELGPNVRWHRLPASDSFALHSALEAAGNAGLSLPLEDERAGVFFGSSTGGLLETERYFEGLVRRPGSRPPRRLLASHLIGTPAETVAHHLGVCGPVETISSACASGGLAIEQALRAIRALEVDIAIAGGADCLSLTTYSGFNALRAVDENPCRPFRVGRAGISLGEGGAVLVLEALEHAVARGAQPLAEVLGAASTCDAHHMTAPLAEGEHAALAIERAIADANLTPDAIDFVNAHGTGTSLNDAAEAATLRRVFGGRSAGLPVEATKGVLGHLLGAAGAIAAVVVVQGLLDRLVHPAPGGGAVDAGCCVDLVLNDPRSIPGMRAAVSASLGFGGANVAVVLGRWEQP
jgi:3-oxoacyl-(acyl-carrier-protein) synthase